MLRAYTCLCAQESLLRRLGGAIWSVKDQIPVSYMQGEQLTCCAVTPTLKETFRRSELCFNRVKFGSCIQWVVYLNLYREGPSIWEPKFILILLFLSPHSDSLLEFQLSSGWCLALPWCPPLCWGLDIFLKADKFTHLFLSLGHVPTKSYTILVPIWHVVTDNGC